MSLIVIACALVLRMVVPSGWMPVADAHGAVVLAPCPTAEPQMMHGSQHSDHKKQDQHGKGSDCSFAPLHAGIDLWGAAPAPSPPIAMVQPRVEQRIAQYLPTGPPAPPPPATGPPTLT